MIIETTILYILVSVWITLIVIEISQVCEKSKSSTSILSQIRTLIWIKFSMLPQPVGLLKLMLDLFYTSSVEGRQLY